MAFGSIYRIISFLASLVTCKCIVRKHNLASRCSFLAKEENNSFLCFDGHGDCSHIHMFLCSRGHRWCLITLTVVKLSFHSTFSMNSVQHCMQHFFYVLDKSSLTPPLFANCKGKQLLDNWKAWLSLSFTLKCSLSTNWGHDHCMHPFLFKGWTVRDGAGRHFELGATWGNWT